jgi:hypothetical protein
VVDDWEDFRRFGWLGRLLRSCGLLRGRLGLRFRFNLTRKLMSEFSRLENQLTVAGSSAFLGAAFFTVVALFAVVPGAGLGAAAFFDAGAFFAAGLETVAVVLDFLDLGSSMSSSSDAFRFIAIDFGAVVEALDFVPLG